MSKVPIWTVGLIMAGVCFVGAARADSDKLPITFDSLVHDVHMSAAKFGLQDPVDKVNCVEATNGRKSCNYKFGADTVISAQTDKGGQQITTFTIICQPGSVKCPKLCLAEIMLLAPEAASKKEKIVTYLFDGIRLGNEARLMTEETKFILQNNTPAGVWFHIQAANEED